MVPKGCKAVIDVDLQIYEMKSTHRGRKRLWQDHPVVDAFHRDCAPLRCGRQDLLRINSRDVDVTGLSREENEAGMEIHPTSYSEGSMSDSIGTQIKGTFGTSSEHVKGRSAPKSSNWRTKRILELGLPKNVSMSIRHMSGNAPACDFRFGIDLNPRSDRR
jgi:hypothetical protein